MVRFKASAGIKNAFLVLLKIKDPPMASLSTILCLPLANSCERFALDDVVPP